MALIVLHKYSALFFLIMIFTSSLAGANDLALSSALAMHPINSPLNNISAGCFPGRFVESTRKGAALEREDTLVSSESNCFKENAAIPLHKDGKEIVWSLAPSLSKFSLDPLDVIKNVQVLLQYRF